MGSTSVGFMEPFTPCIRNENCFLIYIYIYRSVDLNCREKCCHEYMQIYVFNKQKHTKYLHPEDSKCKDIKKIFSKILLLGFTMDIILVWDMFSFMNTLQMHNHFFYMELFICLYFERSTHTKSIHCINAGVGPDPSTEVKSWIHDVLTMDMTANSLLLCDATVQ